MHNFEGLNSKDQIEILTKFKQKRFEEIISIICEKIKINPDSGPLHHLLGMTYISVNSIEDAITSLEIALAKNFSTPDLHYTLGLAHKRKGSLDSAVASFHNAITLKKDHFNSHQELGKIFFNRKDFENTERHYLECIRIKPDHKVTKFILALMYFKQKKFERSEKYFNIVLSLDFKNQLTNYYLGKIFQFRHEYRKAEKFFIKATRLESNDAAAWFDLGEVKLVQGKYLEAKQAFLNSIKGKKNNSSYHLSFFVSFLVNQKYTYEAIFTLFEREGISISADQKNVMAQAKVREIKTSKKDLFSLVGVRSPSTLERSIQRYGYYEPFMVDKIMNHVNSSDLVYDIGADIGYYSVLFSKVLKCKKVVSVEPNKKHSNFLEINLANNDSCVHIKKYIGNRSAEELITIDDLVSSTKIIPTVIKIDIEGSEVEALEGAKSLLISQKPKLFMEFHPKMIYESNKDGIIKIFDLIFSIYKVEFIRNHFGSVKGPSSDKIKWFSADKNYLLDVCKKIISENDQPRGFGLFCS